MDYTIRRHFEKITVLGHSRKKKSVYRNTKHQYGKSDLKMVYGRLAKRRAPARRAYGRGRYKTKSRPYRHRRTTYRRRPYY